MRSIPDNWLAKEFEERHRAFEANTIGFVKTELELAKTFIEISETPPAEKTASHRINARKAYDTLLYFLRKVTLSEKQKKQFAVNNIEVLKSDLEKLGETFPSEL